MAAVVLGRPLQLSVDELMARSREMAGVDIVDAAVIEPLTILHRSCCEEGQLNEEGAKAHTRKLLRLLSNRLRMQRDFLRHPEIAEQQIDGPLIVMGLARSGTTKLQKALAASGDFNWLPLWQAFNWASFSGEPNEPTEARIAEADAFCRWFDARSPYTRLGHAFDTHEPEEETLLSEGCFVSATFLGYVEAPSYAQWLATQSPGIYFEFVRDALKYLQWQGLAAPGKRWLLKAPIYNGLELEILKVFPDARLVIAHRSPLETLPSMCKLVQCFRKAYSDAPLDVELLVEGNFVAMGYSAANRRAHPELPLLDVAFAEITSAFPDAVAKIYAHAGLTLTPTSRQRMLEWDARNAMHKEGRFEYSLDEFGLDANVIRHRLADYFQLLDSLSRRSS